MESIEQTFNGSADWGKKVTCTISRNGDLIHRTYLRVELPAVTVPAATAFRWVNWVGHQLISSVELEIGGQRIDKHFGDWLHIWNELTQSAGHQLGYANMVGNTPDLTSPTINTSANPVTVAGKVLYIPLEFWFNRNAGLALPLIALQYHEVKINLQIANVNDCYWAATSAALTTTSFNANGLKVGSLNACSLYVDYIYLDTDERRRFAQVSHEYLVEQVQFTGDESISGTTNKLKLLFNHPTKELIWVIQSDKVVSSDVTGVVYGNQWFNYSDDLDYTYVSSAYNANGTEIVDPTGTNQAGSMPGIAAGGANNVYIPVSFENGVNPMSQCKLQLNGHDRFSQRDGRYFNLVQSYQHHENVPSVGINVYSFALKPEEHQPSGTCNFSRIDNATLQIEVTPKTFTSGASRVAAKARIYAVNYNVLRIMSGMGGLAYSN
jgi:hypothetical protein